MKGCLLLYAPLLLTLSCQEAPTPPAREAVSSGSQSAATTPAAPTQQTTPNPAPSTQSPSSPTVRALDDNQAASLIRASCIYAGCHTDITLVMASPILLTQLQNNLMPPPNQQRYTLGSADRTALVNYLQKKNAALSP